MPSWELVKRYVLERDNHRCRVCGRGGSNQVHHILPRGAGGSDDPSNLITLCGRCHMLVSPVPDSVVSKVWNIPIDKVWEERAAVLKALDKECLKMLHKKDTEAEPGDLFS